MIVRVETEQPYDILIEKGSIDKVGEVMNSLYKRGTKALIVSDDNVFPIYGQRVIKSLQNHGFIAKYHVFKAGEENKNIDTISGIYKALAENGITRTDLIIALGGGVTGDMSGFAAATFLRGIDFIQIPTSLLAQVDSSVGGKTAIDLPFGKNLVGAFHQPKAVICDTDTLKTLPEYYFIDGLAEIAKFGCIDDIELFEQLENGSALENLDNTIFKSIDGKRRFVEADPNDRGIRMMLNFGHTFGHAIEKLHGFTGISHGRAVAIGMNIACTVGEYMNYTEKGTAERVRNLLVKLGLPIEDNHTLDEIIDATNLDKKSVGKKINLIFVPEIGKSIVKQEERSLLILKIKLLLEQQRKNAKSNL